MTSFTGTLAVLHTTSSDRRRLGEPGPELTRTLPLPLVRPGKSSLGYVSHVWRDGNLIRYSGQLNDSHPDAEKARADIETGQLVGALDADNITDAGMKLLHQGRVLSKEEVAALPIEAPGIDLFETELSGWRVAAVTLMPAKGKAWPEVSLTLDAAEGGDLMTALGYTITQPLQIPDEAYNKDGIATLVVTDEAPRQPARALEAAHQWIRESCDEAGVVLALFKDLNSTYGPDEAPFFSSGQALIDRRVT